MHDVWTSADWREHFEYNREHLLDIPWNDSWRLTAHEMRAISSSVQQFQLGEGSDGRHFINLAREYAAQTGDYDYVEAVRLFIAEEQRHSRDLGRLLHREGIPVLQRHWTDSLFRRLRRLLKLDLCVSVLVTAEIVARVYYKALFAATASPVLRRLREQILRDEAAHVAFQGSILNKIRQRHSQVVRTCCEWLQRGFMLGTMAIVWLQHFRVYQAAGYSLFRYAGETLIELEKVLAVVCDARSAHDLLAETSVNGEERPPFFIGQAESLVRVIQQEL